MEKKVQCSAEISPDELIKFVCDLEGGHQGPHIAWDPNGHDDDGAPVGYTVVWPVSLRGMGKAIGFQDLRTLAEHRLGVQS